MRGVLVFALLAAIAIPPQCKPLVRECKTHACCRAPQQLTASTTERVTLSPAVQTFIAVTGEVCRAQETIAQDVPRLTILYLRI